MKTKLLLSILTLSHSAIAAATAAPCRQVILEDGKYSVCSFVPSEVNVSFVWKKSDGTPYGSFTPVAADFKSRHEDLLFAGNGGPFHSDLTPSALFIEKSKELVPAMPAETVGVGSLYLKPGGVFFIENGTPKILTTQKYLSQNLKPEYALQAAPMLVLNDERNMNLSEEKAPLRKRSGVCIRRDKDSLLFGISDVPVTIQAFSNFFKLQHCSDALMLDTSTSSFFAPSLRRADLWVPLGPMIAVTAKKKAK